MEFKPNLDNIILEIRYEGGHLYFDRCGQCLLDIENECPGWLTRSADVNTGTIERIEKQYRVGFNHMKFDFTARQAFKTDLDEIAAEMSKVWRIVQANLSVDVFVRIGYRALYLLAAESVEKAESQLRNSTLNVSIPESLESPKYDIRTRQTTTAFVKDGIEYRVQLGSITRYESVDPSNILSGDPRALSQRQKEYRLTQLKQMAEYSGNPMYAIALDIDCAEFNPSKISVVDYVMDRNDVISEDFLPVLEEL